MRELSSEVDVIFWNFFIKKIKYILLDNKILKYKIVNGFSLD